MPKRKWLGAAVAAWVSMGLLSGAAQADIVESFEGVGLPAGWFLFGGSVGGVSGASGNVSATAGSQFGYIDTTGGSITSFTGVSGTTQGSFLLSVPFTLSAGSALTMDLNYLSNDGGGFSDYALVQLLNGGGVPVATLFSAQSVSGVVVPGTDPALALTSGVVLTPGSVATLDGILTGPVGGITYGPGAFGGGPGGSTGWVTSAYVVPLGGTYQLRFLVSDVNDTGVDSALLFDNIRTVPEPGMSVLFAAAVLAVVRRARRRTAS
jgi:hypothetical protein